MKINTLRDNLANGKWAENDYRELKREITIKAQESMLDFHPLNAGDYENNPIQLMDFFCGAGGTSLGFASINKIFPTFKMLGGCDINKVSAESYSHNFGTPVINQDITELAYEEGKLDEMLKRIGYDPSKPTVLIGCAPCQGFTSHRKRYWDEEDDGRNTLILAFAEIVKKMNPDVIVMENVPEFLSNLY